MLRAPLSILLLFFLSFGLTGMNVLAIHTPVAESADEDVSSERHEEKTLRNSSARQSRARGRRLTHPGSFTAHSEASLNRARDPSRSLFPPYHRFGKSSGLLQAFRI
jgi:hypothetical protein